MASPVGNHSVEDCYPRETNRLTSWSAPVGRLFELFLHAGSAMLQSTVGLQYASHRPRGAGLPQARGTCVAKRASANPQRAYE